MRRRVRCATRAARVWRARICGHCDRGHCDRGHCDRGHCERGHCARGRGVRESMARRVGVARMSQAKRVAASQSAVRVEPDRAMRFEAGRVAEAVSSPDIRAVAGIAVAVARGVWLAVLPPVCGRPPVRVRRGLEWRVEARDRLRGVGATRPAWLLTLCLYRARARDAARHRAVRVRGSRRGAGSPVQLHRSAMVDAGGPAGRPGPAEAVWPPGVRHGTVEAVAEATAGCAASAVALCEPLPLCGWLQAKRSTSLARPVVGPRRRGLAVLWRARVLTRCLGPSFV